MSDTRQTNYSHDLSTNYVLPYRPWGESDLWDDNRTLSVEESGSYSATDETNGTYSGSDEGSALPTGL